jgi:hypothetical protein
MRGAARPRRSTLGHLPEQLACAGRLLVTGERIMRARRARLVAMGVALAAGASAGCAIDLRADEYTTREEKRFVLEAGRAAEVELVTFDGSVEVRGWDRPEVHVTVEKTGVSKEIVDAMAVRSSQEGGKIRLEAVPASTGDWMAGLVNRTSHHARLIATVPSSCHLLVRTRDGNLKVEGVNGRVDLETDDGGVRGVALGGDVRVRTGDGSIKLESLEGRLVADTSDGSIVLGGQFHGLTANTGDGSISIRLEPGSRPDTDWDISTSDGGISVQLPDPFSAELDASTGEGVVRGGQALGLAKGEKRPAGALRGRLGEGGRLVRIRSGDGSITLSR